VQQLNRSFCMFTKLLNTFGRVLARKLGPSFTLADLSVHMLILILGALQYKCYIRAPDWPFDTTYVDLARSILQNGTYRFNFGPEALLPPGLPVILALVSAVAGYRQAVLYHVMALSAMLGLAASYELLRRAEGRAIAASACLLLGSSPGIFMFGTRLVFSDLPYLFITTVLLLLAVKVERNGGGKARMGWMLLFGVLMVLVLMIRSSGIALLAGICTWIAASFLANPSRARRLLRFFFIPLVLGLSVQVVWTEYTIHRQNPEWPVPGWPKSYLSQISVKSGNRPELGMATLRDLPDRIAENLTSRAAELSQLLTRKWISPFWCSPAVFGVVCLILIGLATSLGRGGGQLHDWYFFWYELMYLTWPWNFEIRFLLPVVPLACLYIWRGTRELKNFCIRRPGAGAVCFVLVGAVLALSSAVFVRQAGQLPAYVGRQQALGATCFWSLVALTAGTMLATRHLNNSAALSRLLASLRPIVQARLAVPVRAAAVVGLTALVAYGAALQLDIARQNVNYSFAKGSYYPDIEAAEWIQSHAPRDSVIMARKQDLVFHYSQHRVIWFPPVSDPDMLMNGIRRHHVAFVVVVDHHHRQDTYWRPAEDVCFESLLRAYGPEFQVVHHGPDNWVYAVEESDWTLRTPPTLRFNHLPNINVRHLGGARKCQAMGNDGSDVFGLQQKLRPIDLLFLPIQPFLTRSGGAACMNG
jgi:hypothetical protein